MGESACVDVEESLGYRSRALVGLYPRAQGTWIRHHPAGERPA